MDLNYRAARRSCKTNYNTSIIMFSRLQVFQFQHLSVGNALQNLAFYSLVMLMLAVIVVQLNVHTETGMRRFIIACMGRISHMKQPIWRTFFFKVKQLFISRH